VSTTEFSYMGHTAYKMDPKYRVSIPTHWRPAAGEPLYLLSSTTHDMPVIKVLSQKAYDHRKNTVKNSDLTPKEKTEMLGAFAMQCRAANVNDQGKLLIPKDLSEAIGIRADSEVVLAGRDLHFEVWSKENHAKVLIIEKPNPATDIFGIF
jgi:DNA-binding transcriptional regulator/RsmH inhibitor MraZ